MIIDKIFKVTLYSVLRNLHFSLPTVSLDLSGNFWVSYSSVFEFSLGNHLRRTSLSTFDNTAFHLYWWESVNAKQFEEVLNYKFQKKYTNLDFHYFLVDKLLGFFSLGIVESRIVNVELCSGAAHSDIILIPFCSVTLIRSGCEFLTSTNLCIFVFEWCDTGLKLSGYFSFIFYRLNFTFN